MIKVWRLNDGRLYGGAGEHQDVLGVKAWLEAGAPEEKKPKLHDTFCAMVIDTDGQCTRWEDALIPMPVYESLHAIGSGRDCALAAMHLGDTAEKAVEVAAQCDMYTSATMNTLLLADAVGAKGATFSWDDFDIPTEDE